MYNLRMFQTSLVRNTGFRNWNAFWNKLNEFKTNYISKIWRKLLPCELSYENWRKISEFWIRKLHFNPFSFLRKKIVYNIYSQNGLTRSQIFGKNYLKIWKMCYDFGFLCIYLKGMFHHFQLLPQNRIDEEKSCKGPK